MSPDLRPGKDNGFGNPNPEMSLRQFSEHQEWFHAFLKNTNQKEAQANILLNGLQSLRPDFWQKIVDPNYWLNVSFIGAGTGKSEIAFLSNVVEQRRSKRKDPVRIENINIYYLDPSTAMHDNFRATLARTEPPIYPNNFKVTIFQFEDPRHIPSPTDITIGFQMWHYVRDWQGVSREQNSLTKLSDTVKERDGVAVISLQSAISDNMEIRGKYIPQLHGKSEIVAEDVTKELDNLGIQYKYMQGDSTLDISSFFREGIFHPNQTGRNLLSFILRVDWDEISIEMQQQIAQDITKIVERNEKPEFVLRDGYIFITKPPDALVSPIQQ